MEGDETYTKRINAPRPTTGRVKDLRHSSWWMLIHIPKQITAIASIYNIETSLQGDILVVKVQCAELEAQGIEFYCKHLVCIYVMFEWKSKVLRTSKIRVKVIMAEDSRIISISKEITLSFANFQEQKQI